MVFYRVMNIVTKNVMRLLEERKWTQFQLAKLSGLNESGLSRLLNANSNPTLSSIEKLARAFDIKASDLLLEYSIDSLGPISGEEKTFIRELRNIRSDYNRQALKGIMKALSDKAAR